MPMISSDSAVKDIHGGSEDRWPMSISVDGKLIFNITTGAPDAPMWNVSLMSGGNTIWENYDDNKKEKEIAKGDYFVKVKCPKGARYGDTISVSVTIAAGGATETAVFSARATQSLLILKTQVNQERDVADTLSARVGEIQKMGGEEDIYAILSPATLRGYVIVEGMNTDRLQQKTKGIRKARSFIEGEASLKDIEGYLTPLSTVVGIVEGDIVELINGPFKGEKARVQVIDQKDETITVELIDAIVSIPVTVKGDSVRVINKEK